MNLEDLLVSYNTIKVRPRPLPELFSSDPSDSSESSSLESNSSEPSSSEPSSAIEYVPMQSTLKPKLSKVSYKNRNEWVAELTEAYKKAGIINDNALKMLIAQDALESTWGRSAQGRFNFGNLTTGASWKGDYISGRDKNAKGESIRLKFRSYKSIDEYAANKVQFLKKLYDFDENDNINKFVAKLTGLNRGKRKYAESLTYARDLTNIFNSFKDGGIIKAQRGIALSDNTRVSKPVIQEKILRTYPKQLLPLFVLDNRSDWERLLSYDRALVAYNQYMQDKKTEEGLQDLNGFLTFADYATMGIGLGSLITKGLKRVGKKAVKLVSKLIANNRNVEIVAKPFLKEGFLSELDWSPKSWFEEAAKRKYKDGTKSQYIDEDIEILKSHLPEYQKIEEYSKKNGNWLKMEDGSTWEGDPRSWVQLQSELGKYLVPRRMFNAMSDNLKRMDFPEYEGLTWLLNDYNMALKWSGKDYNPDEGGIFEITYPKDISTYEMDAEGRLWNNLPNVFNYKLGDRTLSLLITNSVANLAEMLGYGVTKINNVVEGFGDLVDDVILKSGTPRKSLVGNNGNFNLKDKNIYRGIIGTYGLHKTCLRNDREK